MKPPSLHDAAIRLGIVYGALVKADSTPLGAWALPRWMEPSRLRSLGGFAVTSRAQVGLSAAYSDGVLRSDSQLWQHRQDYDADLRVFVAQLRPALSRAVREGLLRQERELRRLHSRVSRSGMDDRLHESAVRISLASGGLEPTREDLREIETARGVSLYASGSSREQYEFNIGQSPVTRRRVLQAVKAERDALEAGSADPLDPREERAQNEAAEISSLLAIIAVHADMVRVLHAYAESPLKGNERFAGDIVAAAAAIAELRERLTESPDDAWAYAPLVVTALAELRLLDVPGLPEYAVAIGRVLSRTITDTLTSGATMLLIGLTLAFTGPVGLVVVGSLDLAMAGTEVAIMMLRAYEQDIAATASDFTAEEQKLAEHVRGEDMALGLAGALLSAIALFGPAKQLLKAKPRAPEVLRKASPYAKPLKLDPSDHASGFNRRLSEQNRATASTGYAEDLRPSDLNRQSAAAGKTTRTGGLTKGQLESRARTPRGTEERPTFGLEERSPEYTLDPAADTPAANPPAPHDYQDFNAIPPERLETPPAVVEKPSPLSSVRELTEADLSKALPPPDLEALFKRQRVSPREQVTGVFQREANPEWFRDRRQAVLRDGASDPLAPHIKFSKENPPEVDHIVAENLIRKFDGFTELPLHLQDRVLHMEANLHVVSKRVNGSRGDMPFSLWEGTSDFKLAPDVRAAMIAKERALAVEIQEMIVELLAQQRRVRGTSRTASGAASIGLRLTGDASRGLQTEAQSR